MTTATVTLPVAWAPGTETAVGPTESGGHVALVRGRDARVAYGPPMQGVVLQVELQTLEAALRIAQDEPNLEARSAAAPGRVSLVTGDLPDHDRALLRAHKVSFWTADGTVELWWPNLRLSVRQDDVRAGRPARRARETSSRTGLVFSGSHVRILQSLLDAHVPGNEPLASMQDLVARAAATPSAVSKVVARLEQHGLIVTSRDLDDSRIRVPHVTDGLEVARTLRDSSAFDRAEQFGGYVYGRDLAERLAKIATLADDVSENGHALTVTGLIAAASYGAVRTGITQIDLWVRVPTGHEPRTWLLDIGLDVIPLTEKPPLRIAIDRTGAASMGVARRQVLDVWTRTPQLPRTWADVYDLPRGPDIADQLVDWHATDRVSTTSEQLHHG